MNLHLVFESSLLPALKDALLEREYKVSGSDVTLDQFLIAVQAGKLDADTVLVDGALGVDRVGSVRSLKQVRVAAPNLRLIVILSSADTQWVKELGMLGIYDVYITEQFQLSDIEKWIQNKKTLADVPDFGEQGIPQTVPVSSPEVQFQSQKKTKDSFMRQVQRIRNWTAKKREEARNKRAEAALKKREEEGYEEERTLPEEHTGEKPFVGLRFDFPKRAMAIGVVGLRQRSGTTHTVLALASAFAKEGLKVAAIEGQLPDKPSDFACLEHPFKEQEGITLYPNVTAERIPALLSLPFDIIVLDLGSMDEEQASLAMSEWRRSDYQLVVLSAAPWDIRDFVQRGKKLADIFADMRGYVLVNYADQHMFKETSALLQPFGVRLIHVPYVANPFEGKTDWALPLIPERTPKKRRFAK